MATCPSCQSSQRDSENWSQKYKYIPLEHHIKLMYTNRFLVKILHIYRAELQRSSDDQISDVWCADIIQSDWITCLFEGSSDNEWAMMLQFVLDGVQTDKLRSNEVWPLICLNLNLPPSDKFKEDNILPIAITSGPKELIDLNSFLSPMIDEI